MANRGVNRALTVKRRQRVVENDEYGAFIRRVVRAYGRRVADGDVEALKDLVDLSDEIERSVAEAVAGLRLKHDYSWTELATRLGVTRQGAQQRWGGRKSRARPKGRPLIDVLAEGDPDGSGKAG